MSADASLRLAGSTPSSVRRITPAAVANRTANRERGHPEWELVQNLLAGDEDSFRALLDEHQGAMQRIAFSITHNRSVAEEVVQEAWTGVLESLPRFQFRSSLKTWLFRILMNKARTRAERERRMVCATDLGADPLQDDEGESNLFDRQGAWSHSPACWDQQDPETLAMNREVREVIETQIKSLPERQKTVVSLRDLSGWSASEVCELMNISEANQRVLLHRARAKVRSGLDQLVG